MEGNAIARLRKAAGLFLCLALIFTLTACENGELPEYQMPEQRETLESGVICSNERFEMRWSEETQTPLIFEKSTGKCISPIPYDFMQTGEYNGNLLSPITIDYYDTSNATEQKAICYDCVEDGYITSEKTENGARVTYYFKEPGITVSLRYTLREDSMFISVNSDEISETGKMKLIRVSIAPYLCSVKNTQDHSNYLFVPAGSGALMYTDSDRRGLVRSFSGEVYGFDQSHFKLDNPGDEAVVRLPVYGAKSGATAVTAIIEQGAGAATLNAVSGDTNNGYSYVGADFDVRGYCNTEWDTGKTVKGVEMYQDALLLNEDIPKGKTYGIGVYPLSGNNADYNGMAKCYKSYLSKSGMLNKADDTENLYNVTLVGGATLKKYTLGFPHETLITLTSLSEAQEMLTDLTSQTGEAPQTVLNGFGVNGVSPGKLAGGYKIASSLGTKKDLNRLKQSAEKLGVTLYLDFDVLRFGASGGGFSYNFDCAVAANGEKITVYPTKCNVRAEDTDKKPYRLLKGSKLADSVKKAMESAEKYGVSPAFSTLGSIAYSDYNGSEYSLKAMSYGVQEMMKKTVGKKALITAANSYAAGLAGSITDAPVTNGDNQAFDEAVPFYGMVYTGTVPLYSEALNLSADLNTVLLKAVESGIRPSFTLCKKTDMALVDSAQYDFYAMQFDGNVSVIVDTISSVKDYYKAIIGAEIVSHRILKTGVSETVFDNGVCVTVNNTESAYNLGNKTVESKSFEFEMRTAGEE